MVQYSKIIKNYDDTIVEHILLNIHTENEDYFIGYDGMTINVYNIKDAKYNLLFSPYNSMSYQAEPYMSVIGPINGMNTFEFALNAIFKAIRWIDYRDKTNNVELGVSDSTLERFLELSIYYYLKTDNLINMEKFNEINYEISKDYNVLDYGGSITYTKAVETNEEDK